MSFKTNNAATHAKAAPSSEEFSPARVGAKKPPWFGQPRSCTAIGRSAQPAQAGLEEECGPHWPLLCPGGVALEALRGVCCMRCFVHLSARMLLKWFSGLRPNRGPAFHKVLEPTVHQSTCDAGSTLTTRHASCFWVRARRLYMCLPWRIWSSFQRLQSACAM